MILAGVISTGAKHPPLIFNDFAIFNPLCSSVSLPSVSVRQMTHGHYYSR